MTVLLRSLIVWLMLLALPYQGYASATMMLCAPASGAVSAAGAHAAMPSGPHDHAAMLAAMEHGSSDHHAQVAAENTGHAGHAHGGAVKCGGSSCCFAGAPLVLPTVALAPAPASSTVIPFYSDFLPAVDLAHPERPPQDILA